MKTDNELIADFMGHNRIVHNPDYFITQHGMTHQNELCYSTSWDWLMPVVEKINSIGYDVLINATGLHNETHSCDITTTTDVQAATTSKVLIECVYKAVVEFIKWYNSQK